MAANKPSKEAILAAFFDEGNYSPPVSYTHLDVYKRQEWGLSGSANASERRRTFLRILGLPPRLSKKEIIQVLNTLYTRAALHVKLQAMK